MPKILVVFYSRTGTTKKAAQKISQKLDCELEEIISEKDRTGIWGYLTSGREAMRRIPAKIKPTQKDPSLYDLTIIGTPMWGYTLSSPTHAYLLQNKDKFKNLAFFCVRGGENPGKVFSEMENISGQKPKASLALLTKEVVKDSFDQKIDEFINKLNN